MLIDSHCHLNDEELVNQIDNILLNTKQAGVDYMLSACTDVNEFDEIINIANKYSNIFASIAEHPCEINKIPINDMIDLMLTKINDNPKKVLCVGECGLDYSNTPDPQEKIKQMDYFSAQLDIAIQSSLPVMIHTRDASDDTYKLLKDFVNKGGRGVIHCFTGNQIDADRYLDLGFYLSASGIITFKKSDNLRSVFAKTPINKILIETDSPYLAPVPMRGKTNEPAFIKHTAIILAEIKNTSLNDIENITSQNFQTLYRIDLN